MAISTSDIFEELGSLDPASQTNRVQSLLNAAAVDLMALVQKPSREKLEEFLEAAREALQRLPAFNRAIAGERAAFAVGQTAMLVDCAQWATLQKVPDQAVETLRFSPVKRAMIGVLVRQGRMGMLAMAKQVGKRYGNLRKFRDELVDAGLVSREEMGRNVYHSATPIGAAALDRLEQETADKPVPQAPPAVTKSLAEPVPSSSDWRRAVRDYVKSQRDSVGAQPYNARPQAAARAAHTFRKKFTTAPPLKWARNRPAYESLASKVVACESYLLSDSELCLVASDPGIYLPSVLDPLDDGMGLNVGSYLEGGLDLIRANVDHEGEKWLWLEIGTEMWRRRETQLAPVPTIDIFPEPELVSV